MLEGAGLAIVDSTVINEYLEEAYPDVPLMPSTAPERAACRMWEDMADHFMASHVTTLIREVFMKPDGAGRDQPAVDRTLAAFGSYLDALERRLSQMEHLCGQYARADIATWLCLTFTQILGVTMGERAGVQAWHEWVSARPVIARELDRVMTAAAVA